jgi:cellulose synthase/poly-beta-1,6-N-acetylglucosamine synthase-like glycosyltransferase
MLSITSSALVASAACLLLVVFAFPAYGFLLKLLQIVRPRRELQTSDEAAPVTLIISAFNEEAVLAEKLRNCLEIDFPAALLEVLVVSDASSDRTDEIARDFAAREPRIRLLRMPERRGKTAGLNAAITEVRTPFVVFSDANAMYRPDAIRQLVRRFADPRVGYVVGAALYTDAPHSVGGRTEGRYWNGELRLKELESSVSSVVGGDGAIYAIRRELFEPLEDTDINDFVNPMQIITKGYVGVFEPKAQCREQTTGSVLKELRRKRRIVNRSFSGLLRTPQVLNPFRHGLFAVQVWLHKVLRWFSPLLCAAALAFATLAAFDYTWLLPPVIAAWGAMLISALVLSGVLPGRDLPVLSEAAYGLGVAVAATLGIADSLRGRVATTWQTRPSGAPEPAARAPARKPLAVIVLSALLVLAVLGLAAAAVAFPDRAWRTTGLVISGLLTALPFFLYGPLLGLLNRLRRPRRTEAEISPWPSVTLLIAAYNEEKVLREKIENSLALRYGGPLEILVASDGSADGTDGIARSFAAQGVRLFRNPDRSGKAGLLRRAIEGVSSQIVVCSDANTFYDPDAVTALVRRFADPEVGAVTGAVRLLDPFASADDEETWLWRLEKRTMAYESAAGSCVGVDGAMVAVRRELVPEFKDGTVLDDFVLAMSVANRGRRVVFEPAAGGREDSVASLRGEFERRARILAGIVQLYAGRMGLPLLSSGLVGRFVCHKVLRWCAPLSSLCFVLHLVLLLGPLPGAGVLAAGFASLFAALALAKGWTRARFKVGYLFVYQAATFAGLVRGLSRRQRGAWRRTER